MATVILASCTDQREKTLPVGYKLVMASDDKGIIKKFNTFLAEDSLLIWDDLDIHYVLRPMRHTDTVQIYTLEVSNMITKTYVIMKETK
ncbi:hypothetical protein KA478_04325 [Patescibacteria group bacterium]|nr:hypothetical protein [Patescibacteria group bacterium]